jgi:hypothetical protein
MISAATAIWASHPADRRCDACSSAPASSSRKRARRYSSSPVGVSAARRPSTLNAFTPSSRSICCTPYVTEDWLLWSRSAAFA